jgi:hypothetical protein
VLSASNLLPSSNRSFRRRITRATNNCNPKKSGPPEASPTHHIRLSQHAISG